MTKPGPLCHRCPLKDAPGVVWGEGPPSAKLVVIGIGPGGEEIKEGRPFIGPSGNTFNTALRRNGMSRQSMFVTNVVKCYVSPGQPIPPEAIECCRPLLEKELDCLPQAKTILTLGGVPFNAFTGKTFTTTTNKKNPNAWLRGCPFHFGSRTIIPAFHPRFLQSTGFRDSPFFDADLRKAKRWSEGNGIRYKEEFNYNPTPHEVTEYIDECLRTGRCGLDIETSEKVFDEEEVIAGGKTDIKVVGISHSIGSCLGVPPDLFDLLKPLLESPIGKILIYAFNWGFDGFHLGTRFLLSDNVVPFDLMLALNLLYSDCRPKDLGMALSLFTDMPYHKNLMKLEPDRYNAMDTFGALWGGEVANEVLCKMGMQKVFWENSMPLIPLVSEMRVVGANCDVNEAMKIELLCSKALEQYETFWRKACPTISWTSNKELIAFFQAQGMPIQYKLRMGKDKRRHKTPCVDEDVLTLYRSKYGSKTSGLILAMRKLKKAKDFTHIYDRDGRCRPKFKIHGQTQGRMQALDPDVQNIPEILLGTKPRSIIIPDNPDEDVIVVLDFEQIELWLYAYASQDQPLLDVKKRGDYVYGAFFEEFFNRPFFEEGKPRRKAWKRKDVTPTELLEAKSGPLGFIYGRGALSIAEKHGIPFDRAKYIYKKFHNDHPAIGAFHAKLVLEVAKRGYAQNFFGRIRRFPNVRGMRNEILSFPGQTNAADILFKNALIPLYKHLPDFGARILFTVHDSVITTCPKRSLKAMISYSRDVMEAPLPELNNFWIPAEASVGPNWADVIPYEEYASRSNIQGTTRTVQGAPPGSSARKGQPGI